MQEKKKQEEAKRSYQLVHDASKSKAVQIQEIE